MEFHISGEARKRYQFDDSLFSFNGQTIFANLHAARIFANRINVQRDLKSHPELAVKAGQINAMGLMDEIFHHVIFLYQQQKVSNLYSDLAAYLEQAIGEKKLKASIRLFLQEFPPPSVYRGRLHLDEYIQAETDGISNYQTALEEMLLLRLANLNPAFERYYELFDDRKLCENSAYLSVFEQMAQYFASKPHFGPDAQNLVEMLRSPAIAVPNSIKGQLDYIRSRWGDLLGHYLLKLIGSLDMISEEEMPRGFGPGPIRIPVYSTSPQEAERFSLDADWMPNCVLIAKNTYVWLDQLSRYYQRPIRQLDEIPDEVLGQLAEWGFTGIWLIGIWQRSHASARIKRMCGNSDALASAYSIKSYRIAAELGGEEALDQLRGRAMQHGIRLASDMVPNHMAIDSDWVHEHPDWFLSLPYSPYPAYTFGGPDLSEDPRGEIFLEDHYYNRSDAAVVFKYHSRNQNQTFFIYHGNDGTCMPWNDTAQLNYLKPEVREAVLETILDVARRFPIIRFDAAMTLAKRHYHRLWFPEPGGGSDIPSRSEFGMPHAEFNRHMPHEFWQEVVERIAAEAPDTLLLAEAFWLMEGYFVRTLGMHRVYNSAFMNLLRDEENAKYRLVMKNTLEFDPEILKRFVNFMNNPDEHTAVNQFGKGDKYFGICTMLATMPGMPMFGHGQIEGLKEKYGMEYRCAYMDESPDLQLIERHKWQIFPLLKKRYLFADVKNFYLYDFYDAHGRVDENVFAYSNQVGNERALIVYHNRFASTYGWVRTSVAFMDKSIGARRQVDLKIGLNLSDRADQYVIFRDQLSGLQYIRNCAETAKNGLYIQLDAYRAHAFLDFRMVLDTDGIWKEVHDHLAGHGTANIEKLQREIPALPVLQPLREIANPAYFRFLLSEKPNAGMDSVPLSLINEAEHKLHHLIQGGASLLSAHVDMQSVLAGFRKKLEVIFHMPSLSIADPLFGSFSGIDRSISDADWLTLILWVYLDGLGTALHWEPEELLAAAEEWLLFENIETALWNLGETDSTPPALSQNLRGLLSITGWLDQFGRRKAGNTMRAISMKPAVRNYLLLNKYAGKTWFDKDQMDNLLRWMGVEGIVEIYARARQSQNRLCTRVHKLFKFTQNCFLAAEKSGYELAQFIQELDRVGS